MAVQKSRKSCSRRGMRRSHDRLKPRMPIVDTDTGESHLRHQISPDGWYRGRRVVEVAAPEEAEQEGR